MARKMAEAVVKFELLSSDLNSTVSIKSPVLPVSWSLPNRSIYCHFFSTNGLQVKLDTSDSGVKLDGCFVMYNCARMTTLLEQFQRNVDRGEYPPLPPVEGVDFSVLTDKVDCQCPASTHLYPCMCISPSYPYVILACLSSFLSTPYPLFLCFAHSYIHTRTCTHMRTQEEWDLLCGYVLLYPKMMEEVATFKPARGLMSVTLPLKKVVVLRSC